MTFAEFENVMQWAFYIYFSIGLLFGCFSIVTLNFFWKDYLEETKQSEKREKPVFWVQTMIFLVALFLWPVPVAETIAQNLMKKS